MYGDTKRKIYTAVVFIVSLLIFIFSLIPGAFFVSTVNLSGSAGVGGSTETPSTPPNNDPINLATFDNSVSIVSGILSMFSAAYGIQLTRSEFAKLKLAQIDQEMQRQEIEKLRLELELEKQKEKKRKHRATSQRKQKTKEKGNS